MRITIVSDPDLVNSNYRAYQPVMALGRTGHTLEVNRLGEPRFQEATALRSDVLLVHRYADPQIRGLMEAARQRGIGVVWDNDDDLTAIPRSNPNYRRLTSGGGQRIRAALAATVRAADVVTTPSEVLAAQYRGLGADDVRVLENCIPSSFLAASAPTHDGVVVAYLAGLEHQLDYQQLRLQDTLGRLLDAHPGLRVLSIGLGLGLRSDRYEHVPRVDFLGLTQTLARADVGIAPLADIPWNQARSNIKLKEYGAAGLAWLASPVGAYRQLGEGEGGRLVADDGWHDAIGELVADARARRKLAKRAARWAKRQTIDRHVGLWERAFEDARAAAGRAAAR